MRRLADSILPPLTRLARLMRRRLPVVAGLSLLGVASALGFVAVGQGDAPACWRQRFEGDGFVVCRYDPGRDEARLLPAPGQGDFAAARAVLGQDVRRVLFAMNAGMYRPDRSPVGLFVADGKLLSPLNTDAGEGNFFMKPNGVFWIGADGAPRVDETAAFAAATPDARWATQSGPMLVVGGALHPRFRPDGESRLVRNGVGVRGGEALFAISDGPVSFGRFARFMRDGLACPDALYLDGTVSSLWSPVLGRMDRRRGLGTLVVVLRRKA